MTHAAIILDPISGMALAAELRGQLLASLDNTKECAIDASKVERVATPCIQLLLAADRAAAAKGGRLHITSYSPAFALACADMGLAEQLATWSI